MGIEETSDRVKVYLAGPITGIADYRDRFAAAEEALTAAGYIVLNPAVLPCGFTHAAYLRMTCAMLAECDMFMLLPGWEQSKGTLIELSKAIAHQKKLNTFSRWRLEYEN